MSNFKVREIIIHIPTQRSSNEIQSFVVILVPLHFTLRCVVEDYEDHVRFMYDLPNGTTLA
jgi:hypothetical protein